MTSTSNKLFLTTFFFSFLLGCGPSQFATTHLDKYKDLSFRLAMTFHGSKEEVYSAVLRAVQVRGFVITFAEPVGAAVSANIESRFPLPEDYRLISETNVAKKKLKELNASNYDELIIMFSEGDRYTGYNFRYFLNLNCAQAQSDSILVQLSTSREIIAPDVLPASSQLSNKYLNYQLFDEIRRQLMVKK